VYIVSLFQEGNQPAIHRIYHSVGSDVTWHVMWHRLVGTSHNNHSTNSPVVYAAGGTSVIALFICLTVVLVFCILFDPLLLHHQLLSSGILHSADW
jgi:hypothetical protein